jgi:prepilin-type N-terminal cleavage/methylation domain-containing protein
LACDLLNIHSVCRMQATRSVQTRSGFTLIELMIAVAIVGLLISVAVPNLARARDMSRLNRIYSNLRTLDAAKSRWALEYNKPVGTSVDSVVVLSNYFQWGGIQDVLHETYVPNAVGMRSEAQLPVGVKLGAFGPGASILAP